MTTFAIYQDTDDGMLRVGTFTPRNRTSVRHIAEQFFAKCPDAPRGKMYVAQRINMGGGQIIDSPDRVLLA
jgi:hypothetical protein